MPLCHGVCMMVAFGSRYRCFGHPPLHHNFLGKTSCSNGTACHHLYQQRSLQFALFPTHCISIKQELTCLQKRGLKNCLITVTTPGSFCFAECHSLCLTGSEPGMECIHPHTLAAPLETAHPTHLPSRKSAYDEQAGTGPLHCAGLGCFREAP